MTYVPSYLEYSDRGYGGWPNFLSQEDQQVLSQACRDILAERGPLTLGDLEKEIGWKLGAKSPLNGVALWDARYAAVHRALLSLDATPVWKLPS